MIGETRNDAPTWMAALAWVASRIVPAPTVSSGKASTRLRIWALGLTESNVTSIVIKPEPFAAATRSQTRSGGHWRRMPVIGTSTKEGRRSLRLQSESLSVKRTKLVRGS